LVSDIPAGDGKIVNLFYSVGIGEANKKGGKVRSFASASRQADFLILTETAELMKEYVGLRVNACSYFSIEEPQM
jgi:hypothetical protein